jgi:hypothetical protein
MIFPSKEVRRIAKNATGSKISKKTAKWLGCLVEKQFLFGFTKLSSQLKLDCNIEAEFFGKEPKVKRKICVKVFGKWMGNHLSDVSRSTKYLPTTEGERMKLENPLARSGQFYRENKNFFYEVLKLFIGEILKKALRVFGDMSRNHIKDVIYSGEFAHFFCEHLSRSEKIYLRFSKWKYNRKQGFLGVLLRVY